MDKVAVVTGAASGIGFSIAKMLAGEGYKIALLDVNERALEEKCTYLESKGYTVKAFVCDVSHYENVQSCAREVILHYERVDILVNNAGVIAMGSLEDIPLEDIKWVLDINVYGVLHCYKAFLPYLKTQKGHIVNIASTASFFSQRRRGAYSLSKTAVHSISETMKKEVKSYDVHVSTVYPGIIKTNISKSTRYTGQASKKSLTPTKAHSPDLVAKKVLQAIKRNKTRVLAGKEVYFVDLGMRLFPNKMDQFLDKYFT
ncbi:SDR family oxidoreductase [Acidaminobacter sp. JC074]|uniref:SDR family NAD(P)-dependent oxidoreductase n=1 Tax=Acidaminobacter sp. JC074 TaxID=2530199 RepID=UPI001F113DE8|nr:SDR family oxidoreductase [Acidaminobacter sp. JC074]MCH4890130.1 SDR family oxidoreductase [Acidaminobacter sp. JC074]